MTRQNINVGTNEGQGDGDSLRTAFQKINDNFVELYSGALRGYTGSGGFNGYIGSTGYVGSVGLAANAAVTNFGTFLSPSGYTLQIRRGSILDRTSFTPAEGELIYSTNTKRLYIGDGVTPGGNIISGTVGYTGSGGGGAGGGGYIGSIGPIGYTGSPGGGGYIGSIGPIGYTGSPGGGGGGGTTSTLVAGTATLSINTLNETVLPSGLRFEPIENYGFGFGGTIAMQTYGEQLQMLATGTGAFGLFGYGEVIGGPGGVAYLVGNQDGTNEVKIVAGSYTATVNTWEFKNNGDLIIPNAILGSGNQALVVQNTASGVAYLELPVDPSIDSVILANQAVSSATVTIRVGDFGSERNWTFNEFGSLAVPGIIYNNDPSNVGQLLLMGDVGEASTYLALPSDVGSSSMNVRLANSNGDIQLHAGTSTWLFNNTGDLELPGGSVLATGGYDVALVAGNDGNSTFGTVVISTQYPPDLTDRNWTFNSLGEFYLPLGGAIQETQVTNELWGTTTTSLTLVPAGAANGTQRLEIYSTGGGEGDHIHITSGDQNQTDLFLGNDTQYFAVTANGANYIQARSGDASPSPGTSAGPGANVNIYAGSAGDNGGNVADGNSGGDIFISSGISTAGLGGDILINTSSGPDGFGSIELSTDGGSSTWTFNKDNQIVFPDNTIQTTAFVSNTIGFTYTISASGSSDYVFSGPGIHAGNENDPILYLYRGFTYKFVNTTGGSHPFAIRVSNGGAAYTTGVSGSQTGTQTFTVPMDAPSTLYYQCTIHSSMGNTINIV